MKFFRVQSVENVIQIMKDQIKPVSESEKIPLEEGAGRVLAEAVAAEENVPGFSRSVVDGYAVKASDTFGANETLPAFLNVTGEVLMGETSEKAVSTGEAIYVPTGGMLPPGADAVVMIEDCEAMEDVLNVYRSVSKNENIILEGEDVRTGEELLPAGKSLRPQELGALASLGIAEVNVKKRLKIGYLSSGDEIVPFNTREINGAQIRDVNGVTIPALTKQWGYETVTSTIAKDEYDDFYSKAKELFDSCDAVVISGGSSVGERDYTTEVIKNLGDGEPGILVHGISVKPGKPTIFSVSSGKPVLGLPGHPASAMVIYQLFGRRMLSCLQGESEVSELAVKAKVSQNIHSGPGRTDFLRVRLEKEGDGWTAVPVLGKSGLIKTLVESDGLLEVPEKKEGLLKGETAMVHLFY
ncbi:gephyrin-like molybdotransferase Glp [Evansella clarkii]|uniref:molybdopterin molybdotransferase MoeA n=1 Tax=Evansella clarkii TaxID=79879 RepID=UPI0009972F18|nr:gephyrin-like molybdotransferase Glp [Evansella clarkii]